MPAPSRSLFRCFGGKYTQAKAIVSLLPNHRVYVEPYGGAASVLMRKPPSIVEVLGDADQDVVSLYRCVQDPVTCFMLINKMAWTPFSSAEFERACHGTGGEPLERAWRVVVRSAMAFSPERVYARISGFRRSTAVLDRRRWTRDEELDFLTRRTTSGDVELIEIKTPMPTKALFVRDSSHKTLYPSADLSKVIAQCQNYVEKLDRQRDAILANDGVDVTKICAKIIIGCDGDANQQAALRRLNGHLHRIHVITYDGLVAIARRVLAYLEGEAA